MAQWVVYYHDKRDGMDWQNDNLQYDIIKFRILGPIKQEPAAALEQPTIENLIYAWKIAAMASDNAEQFLLQCKAEEQAAREAVQKALAYAGWGDASTAPENTSRSGQEVAWGEWEVGDVVVFDGFTCTDSKCWEYIKGNKYTIEKDCVNDIGPVDDAGDVPEENHGFRFIWP